jgi:hypothetical protein
MGSAKIASREVGLPRRQSGKVALERPRVRAREGGEIALPSWEAAMAEDWLAK